MPLSREAILEGLKRGETLVLQDSFPEYRYVQELENQGLVTLTPGDHGIEVNWNGKQNAEA